MPVRNGEREERSTKGTGFVDRAIGYPFIPGKGRKNTEEVSQVRMVLDIEPYVDSGLLSGLAAKSEVRELLDELYGSLS